jgi:hypothetical protein
MPKTNHIDKKFLEHLVRNVINEQDEQDEQDLDAGVVDSPAVDDPEEDPTPEDLDAGLSREPSVPEAPVDDECLEAGIPPQDVETCRLHHERIKAEQAEAAEGGGLAEWWSNFWVTTYQHFLFSGSKVRRFFAYNNNEVLQALDHYHPKNNRSKQSVYTFISLFCRPLGEGTKVAGPLSKGRLGPGTGPGEPGQIFMWQDPEYWGFREHVEQVMTRFIKYDTKSKEEGRIKFWKELKKEQERANEAGPSGVGYGPTLRIFWQKHWDRFQGIVRGDYGEGHGTGVEGIQATDGGEIGWNPFANEAHEERERTAVGEVNIAGQKNALLIGERMGMHRDEMSEYFSIMRNHKSEKQLDRFDSWHITNAWSDTWEHAFGDRSEERRGYLGACIRRYKTAKEN